MSKTPRIIATSASAALLAATGAGAAVFAVDTLKEAPATNKASKADSSKQSSEQLQAPKDESTTIYRAPDTTAEQESGTGYQNVQPAPPSTGWQSNGGGSSKAGKSHSS